MSLPLAQVQIRDRSGDDGSCVADNGFCPDWIADNFDRYVDPFFEHVLLTLVSLGDRLRDRVRRWRCSPTGAAG